MRDEERRKLEDGQGKGVSIGITDDGSAWGGIISIPWEKTSHAFNMKTPKVFMAPEDLNDRALMNNLKSAHVLGCYVFTPLSDYSFIAELPEVRDINIRSGNQLSDLSFLSGHRAWNMLHLELARLKDLEPIYQSSLLERRMPGFCLSFAGCEVEDMSALYGVEPISELIIIGEDDNKERIRWRKVPALTHRYYTIQK